MTYKPPIPPGAKSRPPDGTHSYYVSWCKRHEEYHVSVIVGLASDTRHMVLWETIELKYRADSTYREKEELLWEIENE